MRRSFNEIFITMTGWWIYLTGYLVLAIFTITVIQIFKVGLDWRLAIPIFIKWEFLIIVFSFVLANVTHFYKYFIQKFLALKGMARTAIIFLLSYLITTFVYPIIMIPIKAANISVDQIESSLAFILIILVIFRSFPQRHYSNPEGPKFNFPILEPEKEELVAFNMFHTGVDFKKEFGTPVFAAADGKIVIAWPYQFYGNKVKIVHGNGFSTAYAHLNDIVVKSGQMVKTGDLIGFVGCTGHAFYPHLHFEIRHKNKVLDPMKYFGKIKKHKNKIKKYGKDKN